MFMRVFVCMCVCVFMYTGWTTSPYVCVCIQSEPQVHVCMYTEWSKNPYVCMYINRVSRKSVSVYVCIYSGWATNLYVCMYVCMYLYRVSHKSICVYVSIQGETQIYMCLCMCVCIYTGWATNPYSPVQEWCCPVLAEWRSHIQNIFDDICNLWQGSVGANLNTYCNSRHCTFTVNLLWPYFGQESNDF